MKKIILLFLLGVLYINITAKETKKLLDLRQSFAELQQSPQDSIKQRKFFNAFPNNFPEFFSCFVYSDFAGPVLDAIAYPMAFRNLNRIPRIEKIEKTSNLLIGMFWQADDAMSTMRDLMFNYIAKYPKDVLTVVSKLTKTQQILLWQGIWENPCRKPILTKMYNILMSTKGFEKEKQIIKNAYNSFFGDIPVMY